MKIRQGFVSNSSSCSFTIPMTHLSLYQYYKLVKFGKDYDTGWSIYIHDDEGVVEFYTGMDNFALDEWLKIMEMYDVDTSAVKIWERS